MNNLQVKNLRDTLKEIQEKAEQRDNQKRCSLDFPLPLTSSKERLYLIDSREQIGNHTRYSFPNSHVTCLPEGDYSINGFSDQVVIERKAINDWISTLIYRKENFYDELQRMQKYESKCIVVECLFSDLVNGFYVSETRPSSAIGLSFSTAHNYNLPVFYTESFTLSNRYTQLYLQTFARKKEMNFQSFASKTPLALESEQTIITLSLEQFINEITVNKEQFKQQIAELKHYKSSAIVLECKYSDILQRRYKAKIEPTLVESIICSIIVDYGINIYFMENTDTAKLWIKSHLKRYLPVEPKDVKPRKPRKKKGLSDD